MHIEPATLIPTSATTAPVGTAKIGAALAAALLGLSLVFVAGFAEVKVLHNATHDTRHSAGFPCH